MNNSYGIHSITGKLYYMWLVCPRSGVRPILDKPTAAGQRASVAKRHKNTDSATNRPAESANKGQRSSVSDAKQASVGGAARPDGFLPDVDVTRGGL